MATNDTLLLDDIIDDLLEKERSTDRGKIFELFALAQVLKEWDLSVDELASGWTDGRQDGGIDGFYVLVNGHCIRDVTDFVWPKVSADIVVHIVTCKHADSFSQSALDAVIASLTEILDLSIDDRNLKGAYSNALLSCRSKLLISYRKLAPKLAGFKVNISYVSRGNRRSGIGVEVKARANQIIALIHECFNGSEANFEFVGATDLVDLYRRRPKFSLDLPFISSLSSSGANYILLVDLEDYFHFCCDDDGKLRRYLFESNVRDFMGLNRVNEDISKTLGDATSPDFWWLNNGVTVLATNAWSTSNTLHMENVQIVNGLQTTESVFRHFSIQNKIDNESGIKDKSSKRRSVMVKVISSVDEDARDRIIRATNNQTSVEQISLHATEKTQRDIEDALLQAGLHYERRKNFYINQGVASGSIVTPMYLAAGMLALGRKREPWSAVVLKQRHLKVGGLYNDIFNSETNLKLWASIASVLKSADRVLNEIRLRGDSEGFLKRNRYLLSLFTISRYFGSFSYTDSNMLSIGCDESFVDLMKDTLNAVPASEYGSGRSKIEAYRICQKVAEKYEIANVERILSSGNTVKQLDLIYRSKKPSAATISDQFIDRVFKALPPQPWKPGLHVTLSKVLGCTVSELFAAVERLVESRAQQGHPQFPSSSPKVDH